MPLNHLDYAKILYTAGCENIITDFSLWSNFLATAANNYKYSFVDQIIIGKERADATALATYDEWQKLGYQVKKGSKGIPSLGNKAAKTITYLFDKTDVYSLNNRSIRLWQYKEEYTADVIAGLIKDCGFVNDGSSEDLKTAVIEAAKQLTSNSDTLVDLAAMLNIPTDEIKDFASDGITAMVLKRCFGDITLNDAAGREFIDKVSNSNSPLSMSAIGNTIGSFVTNTAKTILKSIEHTTKEQNKLRYERSINNGERNTTGRENRGDIHRGQQRYADSAVRSVGSDRGAYIDADGAAGAAGDGERVYREVRNGEGRVSEGIQELRISESDNVQQSAQASVGNELAGSRESAGTGRTDGESGGRERGAEENRYDEVGWSDEQPQSLRGGDSVQRADLRINQLATPEGITQEHINAVLLRGSGVSEGKLRIYNQYLKKDGSKENTAFLKGEYGIGGAYPVLTVDGVNFSEDHDGKGMTITRGSANGRTKLSLTWANIAKRIEELIDADRFLSPKEKEAFLVWRVDNEKRVERGKVAKELSAVLNEYAESISDDSAQVQQLNRYFLSNCISEFYVGDSKVVYSHSANGEFILPALKDFLSVVVSKGGALQSRALVLLDVLNGDMGKSFEPTDKEIEAVNKTYIRECSYKEGDSVFFGTQTFEIASINNDTITLFDPTFPLFSKEVDKAALEEEILSNTENERLVVYSEERHGEEETIAATETEEPTEEAETAAVVSGEEPSELHIGDEVILDNAVFKIDSINPDNTVDLLDVKLHEARYPVFRKEPAARIIEAIKETQHSEEEIAVPEIEAPKEEPALPLMLAGERNNYKIKSNDLGVGTASERYSNNIAAIKLLNTLTEEKRYATPEEQEVLSNYVGWGGLSDYFDERNSKYNELKSVLSEEEYISARNSTLTAFYTPPTIVNAIYDVLNKMNFTSGNVLEPACGTGNFMGLAPSSMSDAKFYGVEIDNISGRIAQQLYQKNNIVVAGYENTKLPDSFFDVAIGNVPFGQFKLNDKKYDKHNFLIHDYFFAKTLDKVRPGGIVAFITSKGTLDKKNSSVRRYIAQRAELLGAVRLPDSTFKAAAGTEVTSDIIFLRKRDKVLDFEPNWLALDTNENGFTINSYFVNNPDMICGKLVNETSAHGIVTACKDSEDSASRLKAAINKIAESAGEYIEADIASDIGSDEGASLNVIPADLEVRNYSFTIVDGAVFFRKNSIMQEVAANDKAKNRIKALIGIRDTLRQLVEYQTEDYPDKEISALQAELNDKYDKFFASFGRISSRDNEKAFTEDSSYPLLCALENFDDNGVFKNKADIFFKRTIKPAIQVDRVDTATEALVVSIGDKGRVDMEYMSELCGLSEEAIAKDLTNIIFVNPLYSISDNATVPKYLTADEYLSGNVREKLAEAKLAASADSSFAVNVEALEKVIPEDIPVTDIGVRLGATWIPKGDIKQFIFELLETPRYSQWSIDVNFSEYTGEWNIKGKSHDGSNIMANQKYGTSRMNAYTIIERTLNLSDARVYDYIEDPITGKKTQVLNKKETMAVRNKQELIKDEFKEWIWNDPERRERLSRIYNDSFNSIRPREYDGSHIKFCGVNNEIIFREYQLRAIARVLYGGNALLAHVVGAGKTYEMIAAAQESKRLGLCNKSLIAVPNHIVEQFASDYMKLYPGANILVTRKKDFEAKNRKKFCSRIATGDYDAIIMGHSQFERIPLSDMRQKYYINSQVEELSEAIRELRRLNGDHFTIKQLELLKKKLLATLEKLNNTEIKDDVVTFEELGVDKLFIDEAHNYKNLFLYSKMRNIGGISQTAAMKSSDLHSKCQYLDEITGGKGVVFATGTPVSNSVAELYTMQRYLQRNTLKKNGLINFDAWASTFGETVTTIELAPEGTGYRAKTRFSKFHNLTELMTMFKECADVVTRDDIAGKGGLELPDVERTVVTVKASEFQKKYIEGFAERADNIRNGTVDPHIDNMLKITSDGRKLALDQRLIDGNLPEDDNGKVAACASNMYKIWNETSDAKLTQLAFCDISTPSDSFNVYDALRNKLVDMGIPKNEVAFIHEYPKEKDKEKLFAQVKRGDVRILVGSTAKLGTGTNVQEKMIAVHHLDCPYRPADMEQREGRVIRQGNDNKKVGIFTYITEGTFDSYMFQMLETKQKFISQIMNSKSPARVGNDVDDAALNYAEIKALASGNPRIKEKMELDMDVARLQSLKSSFKTQHYSLQDQVLKELPMQISAIEQRIKGELKDIATIKDSTVIVADGISPMIINGKSYNTRKEAGEALLAAVKNMKNGNEVEIGSYKGLKLSLSYDTLNKSFTLTSKGAISYFTMLGSDASGNITRLDNTLNFIENDLSRSKERLENSKSQLTIAKEELDKPFTYEAELKEKISRLNELNAELNLDKNVGDTLAAEIEEAPAEEAAEHKSLDDKIDKAIDTAAALNDSHNIEPTKLADREL